MTVTIAQSWIAEGKAEGRVEGRAEGEVTGQAKSTLTALESRFGEVPASVQKKLMNFRDGERIESLFKLALTCQSLKEFQKAL